MPASKSDSRCLEELRAVSRRKFAALHPTMPPSSSDLCTSRVALTSTSLPWLFFCLFSRGLQKAWVDQMSIPKSWEGGAFFFGSQTSDEVRFRKISESLIFSLSLYLLLFFNLKSILPTLQGKVKCDAVRPQCTRCIQALEIHARFPNEPLPEPCQYDPPRSYSGIGGRKKANVLASSEASTSTSTSAGESRPWKDLPSYP